MKEGTTYLQSELLQHLIHGDEQALGHIMDQYHDELLLKAYHLLGDLEEASDAVQEVFIKLWGVKRKLLPDTQLDNYLSTLIRNHCLSCLRKRKVLKARTEKFVYGQPAYSYVKPMENAELAQQLSAAFNTLTDRQRLIFDSVYFEGKTHLEVVQELQIEPQTVKNTISIALKKLRLSLDYLLK
jgi:RNA polymerase sigma factor (sigma-70 family)